MISLVVFLLLFVAPTASGPQREGTEQRAIELQSQAQILSFEWTVNSVRRSLELHLEAAELWRQLGETPKRCAALRGACQQKLMLGDTQGAFSLLLTTWQLEETSSTDISGKVLTLSFLSRTALLLGRYRDCKTYYNKTLALIDRTQDPLAIGEAYYSASLYLYEKQVADQAIKLNDQAIEQFRLAKNKPREIEALIEQSYDYMLRRDLSTGLQLAQQALALSEETNDRSGQVGALIAAGNANITMGEARAAFDAYQRADSLSSDELDHMRRAQIANGLGSLYEKYGDWTQSLNFRERALHLFEAEKNKPGQLYTLVSLGKLANLTNNYELAVRYLLLGEQIAGELGDQFGLAQVWIEQGYVNLTRGATNAARDYYERALRILARLNDRLYVALVRSYLGEVEESVGDLRASDWNYRTALRLNRDLRNRFGEADALYQLARIKALQNRLKEALDLIEQSLKISESLRGGVSNSRLRTSYFSQVHDHFALYINVLMQLHQQNPLSGYDVRALQASERARARTLLDSLRMRETDLSTGADPALLEREKRVRIELTLKSDETTTLLNGNNPDSTRVNKLKNDIDSLSAEYDDVKARLREQSLTYRTLGDPPEFDLSKFQQSVLDDNTLLLEFSLNKEQSYLWVVGNSGLYSYTLPAQNVIEKKTHRIYELVHDRAIRSDEQLEEYQLRLAAEEEEYWTDAQELSNLLLSQAEDKLENKRLVVVADKQSQYLPIAALPKPQRRGESNVQDPLVLNHEIVCQPSANTLLLLEALSGTSQSPRMLLAFADPIFSRDDLRLMADSSQTHDRDNLSAVENLPPRAQAFLRLSESRNEVESIAKLLGPDQATVLTGESASREAVLHANFGEYKIVHFATHGIYDEQNPELSGIVLSQFDQHGNPASGFLRLTDVYQLTMPVDLVVLSACGTGMGKDVSGEGIVGLTRGFMQAGCRSVLSTLWKVDDRATSELMKNYYKALLTENNTPASALRQAQIDMSHSQQWRSPYYWAAFNLYGEFREPIRSGRKPATFPYLKCGVLLGMIIGLVLISRKKFRNRFMLKDRSRPAL